MCHLFLGTLTSVDDESPWLTPDQQEVWRGWLAMSAQLPIALHRQLQEESGLSLPDVDILVQLTEAAPEAGAPGGPAGEGKVRVGDLASALHWERSRVSHQVRRMEARGLVTREECPDDGRGNFVVLTPAGRAAMAAAAPGHAQTVRRLIFDALSPQELATFKRILAKVMNNL
jgi:DNA-binding MarR family transcriptional regulator